MKKLVLTFCMLIAAITTWAAKAYPGPITVTQSDGTKLTVLMYGDEDGHWFTTTDNVLLSHVGTDFFIARIETDGSLQATQQLAHEPAMRNQTERQLALDQQPLRQTFLSQNIKTMESKKQRRIGVGTASPSYFPHTGTPKAMVILVQFADLSFSVADAKKSFNDYLNAEGALPDYGLRENRNHGSVCQYFTDMSQGLFSPQFDLYGPVTASKTWTYYGANSGSSDQSARIEELVREACNAINDTVDFSQYDADGDKRVDLVYVIYAGYSESMGASSDCIWPKSGTLSGGTYDGVSVSRYGVNNELNYTPDREFSEGPSKRMNGIGLFLVTVIGVNLLFFGLYNVAYGGSIFEERYLITVFLMTVILTALFFSSLDSRRVLAVMLSLAMTGSVLAVDVYSDYNYLRTTNDEWQTEEIQALAEKQEAGVVYFWGDDLAVVRRVLRACDLNRIYKELPDNGAWFTHWGDYTVYDNQEEYSGPTLLVCPRGKDLVPERILAEYTLLEELDQVAVYGSDHNPKLF